MLKPGWISAGSRAALMTSKRGLVAASSQRQQRGTKLLSQLRGQVAAAKAEAKQAKRELKQWQWQWQTPSKRARTSEQEE